MVFGPNGMLGRSVITELERQGHIGMSVGVGTCNYDDLDSIQSLIDKYQPDKLLNCAGVRSDIREMVRVNSLLPHMLAQTNVPMIHMSVDCVFSGRSVYRYTVNDSPDARDIFGRTRILGEVSAPHVTIVRTAFIGRDRGFVADLLSGRTTKGQKNVLWTGSTVEAVAVNVAKLLQRDDLPKIVHLSTEKSISRFQAARLIYRAYGRDENEIEPRYDMVVNLSLQPTIVLPSLETALKDWKNACNTVADIQQNGICEGDPDLSSPTDEDQ